MKPTQGTQRQKPDNRRAVAQFFRLLGKEAHESYRQTALPTSLLLSIYNNYLKPLEGSHMGLR